MKIFLDTANINDLKKAYATGLCDGVTTNPTLAAIEGYPSFEKLKETVEQSKILIECQRDISLTMTSIECLAAGVIVLVHKNGGTYIEVLENGKYGFGFETIEEGAEKLKKIIKTLENKKLNQEKLVHRAEFFSEEKFKERLKKILKENDI